MKKKKAIKKTIKKTVKLIKKISKPIGFATHYYTDIKVGIFKFKKPVKVGSTLEFRGATTKFKEKITSMQFDHKSVNIAPKGKQIGIKLKKRVRVGDKVYPV